MKLKEKSDRYLNKIKKLAASDLLSKVQKAQKEAQEACDKARKLYDDYIQFSKND